ncbi:MAG: DNA gyrase inhibitor YacG [Pseudomonadota bacterium]
MNKRPKNRCPLCGAPPAPPYRPFCSRGCADRDLMRWLDGDYVLPGPPVNPSKPPPETQ